jgi:Uri superfamily endonuclease
MAHKPRGTYALLLALDQETAITVGRLGTFPFPAGCYVYVGSALGSGGLAARLDRHRRSNKKIRWHIDYVLAHARVADTKVDTSGQRLECTWAQKLLNMPGAQVVAPRLGSSDCACPSHLIYLGSTGQLCWASATVRDVTATCTEGSRTSCGVR